MSELARQLIAANKAQHERGDEAAKRLDLGNCGLTELPEELFELHWLEELVVSNAWQHLKTGEWKTRANNGSPNKLADLPAGISKLKRLKILIASGSNALAGWRISDINILANLTCLQSINLSNNQLCDISILANLTGLQRLDLSNNQISDISILSNLTGLQRLYLSDNQIRNISILSNLTGLQILDLRSNQIRNISILSNLTGLLNLDLSDNQISDYSFLSNLTGLQILDLSGNQIRDYSFLSNLTGLQILDLSGNQISDISILSNLTGLQRLYLSNNQISDISILSNLTGLQILDLSGNQISDISILSNLTDLQILDLSGNQISDYSILSILTGLQRLYLSDNQIRDISFLSSLTGLQSLFLSSNQISDISILSNLTGLQILDLRSNQIRNISILSNLTGLQNLALSDNQISELPSFVFGFSHLATLHLHENPIANVPAEIIDEWDCLPGVRNYFQSLARGGTANNEVKLLLLGNGRVGKTSLVRAMLDRTFSEDVDSSDKILLRVWEIAGVRPEVLKENSLKVNIWDFGGQEIYYTTHRLFLHTRALFLLVWDRETEEAFTHEDGYGHTFENFKLPHWIDYIRTASKSPVIVVQNKVDRRSDRYAGYEELLHSLYGYIIEFQYVSAKKEHEQGVPELQESIREAYEGMASVGQLIPSQWLAVKERLSELQQKRSIPYDEYIDLCRNEGLEGTEPETLISLLHNSGFLFYLRDISTPKIILDQQWAIDAVYAVLTRSNNCYRDLCRLNRHGFTLSDLDRLVWGGKYSPGEQKELLRFMVNTEICFEFAQDVYIAPQLLTAERPPRVKSRRQWRDPHGPSLKFRFQFLHNAIIERFIVRAGRMVNEKDDDPIIWRNGIAIYDEKSNTDALVEAFPEDKEIKVLTHGDRPLDLIKKIMEELSSLNRDYEPEIFFSVEGGLHFVKQHDLEKFYRAQAHTVPDENGNFVELGPFRPFLQLEERGTFDEKQEKGLPSTELKSKRMEPEKPVIRCFISYAHFYDEFFQVFKDDFETMTASLPFAQLYIWTDEKIPLGADWHEKIQQQVSSCDLAILLVSDRFMTSEYIKEYEVARLLVQQGAGKTLVVPVYFYTSRFDDWPALAKNQFFKPKGFKYGRAELDVENQFCYADLVDFEDLKGGVKKAKNSPYRSRYMMDFVEALEDQLKEMAKGKLC
ncbi:MAG: leucine-rich repeat domain-containing protein [Thermodesulfobacteriota bacterium]